MFKYVLAIGATILTSLGLLIPNIKKRNEAIKTSKCLKCQEGMGHIQQRKNDKASYKCDNCGNKWVERI